MKNVASWSVDYIVRSRLRLFPPRSHEPGKNNSTQFASFVFNYSNKYYPLVIPGQIILQVVWNFNSEIRRSSFDFQVFISNVTFYQIISSTFINILIIPVCHLIIRYQMYLVHSSLSFFFKSKRGSDYNLARSIFSNFTLLVVHK